MKPVVRLLLAVLALGCGTSAGSSPSPTPPSIRPAVIEHQPVAPDAAPLPPDCATACTEIAVCHEEVYEKEYGEGGYCTVVCEERTPAEKEAFLRCVADSRDACARVVEC